MSENLFAPPEMPQSLHETHARRRSAIGRCLVIACIAASLMAVTWWWLSAFSLLVMAFLTPILLKLHFMYSYRLKIRQSPDFAALPIVVVFFGGILGVISSIVWEAIGLRIFFLSTWARIELELMLLLGTFAAGGAIGFELSVSVYLKQRRNWMQLLAPGAMLFVLIVGLGGICQLVAKPVVLFRAWTSINMQVYVPLSVIIWIWCCVLWSTVSADRGSEWPITRDAD